MTLCRKGLHDLNEVGVYMRPDGDGGMCRGCMKDRARKYRSRINESVNQWRKDHPERLRAHSRVWAATRTGLLVKPTGYSIDDKNRAVMYALANEIRRTERAPRITEFNATNDDFVMRVVWNYNDCAFRTWADIQGVFTRAAKNPVIPKP